MPRSRPEQAAHEYRVCLAAVEILARLHGKPLVITKKPDAIDSTQPRCDYEAEGEGLHHVIEHTIVEAYPNRRTTDARFGEIFGRLESEHFPNGVGVNGRFQLVCRSREALLSVRNWDQIREKLARWVALVAHALLEEAKTSPKKKHVLYPASITAQPEGVPFEVTLVCREAKDSRILVASYVPDDLESQTRTRLDTALRRKCPKLAKWKQQYATLVLEECDIALGNEASIASHLEFLLKDTLLSAPDYVVYVDTAIPNEFAVHLLKIEGRVGNFGFLFWNPVSAKIVSTDSEYE